MLLFETYVCTREKEEDKRLYFRSSCASLTVAGHLLAQFQHTDTLICILNGPLWRCLAAYLRVQPLYIYTGVSPFHSPSLNRVLPHSNTFLVSNETES